MHHRRGACHWHLWPDGELKSKLSGQIQNSNIEMKTRFDERISFNRNQLIRHTLQRMLWDLANVYDVAFKFLIEQI